MGLLINCPPAAEIADIPIEACPESVGQIQKIVFQRIESVAGTKNEHVIGTLDPATKAAWTPLLAASDGTKVVQTPYVQAPTTEPGAARTFGGGNETLGGIEIIIGTEPTAFTGMFNQVPQKTIKAIKKYYGEAVGVYFVDEFGRIIGKSDDSAAPTKFMPIPIMGLFVGDKNFGGLEGVDQNAINFKMLPNWSDDLHIVTPTDFNALTDLVTP